MAVSKATATLNRPVWSGGRTLYMGEIVVFVIAVVLAVWGHKWVGKWAVAIALAMCLLAMIIW